jgi:hypothetical protein
VTYSWVEVGERALGWGLKLLGIALFVGPFIAAFAAHDWDLRAAVMPSEEEMAEVQEALTGLFGRGVGNILTFGGIPPDAGQSFTVPVTFNSPFKFPVTITDLSGGISVANNTYRLRMERESEDVPKLENKTFNVIGVLTTEDAGEIVLTFEGYGLTVRLRAVAEPGGLR